MCAFPSYNVGFVAHAACGVAGGVGRQRLLAGSSAPRYGAAHCPLHSPCRVVVPASFAFSCFVCLPVLLAFSRVGAASQTAHRRASRRSQACCPAKLYPTCRRRTSRRVCGKGAAPPSVMPTGARLGGERARALCARGPSALVARRAHAVVHTTSSRAMFMGWPLLLLREPAVVCGGGAWWVLGCDCGCGLVLGCDCDCDCAAWHGC